MTAIIRPSRCVALGAIGAGVLLVAGCMSRPIRPVNADGTWCFRVGKAPRYKLTCTTSPVPSASVEAESKRFDPDPAKLTLYVVRKRWADAANVVELKVDGTPAADTVPESFARLRLAPGHHVLSATWSEGATETSVRGVAGEVQFVELAGASWSWGSSYAFEESDDSSRARARQSRMIADVN